MQLSNKHARARMMAADYVFKTQENAAPIFASKCVPLSFK
jgi:hypothetical protein